MDVTGSDRRIDASRVPEGFRADPTVPSMRIVLLRGEGDLVEEDVALGLDALGHEVMPIRYTRRGGALTFEGAEDDLGKLARRVIDFGPHAIFCCNVEGIGLSGLFPALAETEGAALVAWLVDHPPRDLPLSIPPELDRALIATYDRVHAQSIRALGYRHVEHLPLATHPWRFAKTGETASKYDIGYAGNLFLELVRGLHADLETRLQLVTETERKAVRETVARGIERFSAIDAKPEDPWEWVAASLREDFGEVPPPLDAMSGVMAALVTHTAAGQRRRALLGEIDQGGTHVWGRDWENALPPERCHAPVPYERIGDVYHQCRVNLSISHVQNLDSVTQRVFDVPASGAFVLSDWRSSLGELFEPGREIAVYRSPAEARELADRYLRDDAERRAMVDRAKRRVLSQHTYAHRLEALTRRIVDTWPEVPQRPKRRTSVAVSSPGGAGEALIGRLCTILAPGGKAKALTALSQTLEGSENGQRWALTARAAEALAHGNAEEALALYERATSCDGPPPPHHPAACDAVLFDAGRACAAASSHAEALDWFRRAAARCPRHPLYWSAMAAAFLERQDYGRARASLERALALSPQFPQAVNLARAFGRELAQTPACWTNLLEA